MNRLKALVLLGKCRGDEIWPVDVCRAEGVPDAWIDELADAFESGFDADRNTIYLHDQVVNQFHGVSDLRLAYKLADELGVDTARVTSTALSRTAQVRALQQAVDE